MILAVCLRSILTFSTYINTAAFDPNMCGTDRECIPQPGTTRRLDANSNKLMNRLAYRK